MMVYFVIKTHVNFKTGIAFPSIALISRLSGVSQRQVIRELARLESFGYIARTKVGRSNRYRLIEKVQIADANGTPMAMATWDYMPMQIQQGIKELKQQLAEQFPSQGNIHIEKLQVNITQSQGNTVVFNVAALDELPTALREPLLRMAKRRWPEKVD